MSKEKINEFLKTSDGNYLEIGIYHGDTFFEIAKANPTKKVYGIDPFIADGWTGERKGTVLSEAELICDQKIKEVHNATIFTITSANFSQHIQPLIEMNITCVFIDGSHWKNDVEIDTDLAIKLIGDKPGLIIYDDLHLYDVRTAIKEALEKYPNMKLTDGPKTFDLGGFYTVN